MKKPRKKYDEEFKQNAVNLLLSSGRTHNQVARELGVGITTLRYWRNQARVKGSVPGTSEETKGQTPLVDPAREIRQLRQENEYLRRQREILKKAMSILSEDPLSGMR